MKYIFSLFIIGAFTFNVNAQKGDPDKTYRKFATLLQYIERMYVDSVDSEKLTEDAIRKVLQELDPHSSYIPPKKVDQANQSLKGGFDGIGIRFNILKDTILVVNPIIGGPSEKVGIQAGDKIIKIDGEVVAGTGISNGGVRDRLLGKKGSEVDVSIYRRGYPELLQFTIERDKIPIHSVLSSYIVKDDIGYIKINNFSANTMSEFFEAIEKLKVQGMKRLVLDLQDNGGGYLTTATQLVDQFIAGEKVIVSTDGKIGGKSYKTQRDGVFEEGELVVLINEHSASASEITSGAVQDWDRGIIVGRRSFGKGLVQRPITLTDKSEVRLTTARYYTPSGRCIQKPYDEGKKAYQQESGDRYKNGELYNKDSIKYNEDLKYETKVTHRTVYGGGGIIPDFFVPIDTTSGSSYFSKLIRKGIMNRFSLNTVNDNRKELQNEYPDFKTFDAKFDTDAYVKKLIDYAKEQELAFDENGYERSKEWVHHRLKATIARDLFGQTSYYYQVINNLDPVLNRAIEILEDGSYQKIKLAQN